MDGSLRDIQISSLVLSPTRLLELVTVCGFTFKILVKSCRDASFKQTEIALAFRALNEGVKTEGHTDTLWRGKAERGGG